MLGRALISSTAGKAAALKVQFPLCYNAAIEAAGRPAREPKTEGLKERETQRSDCT